MKDYKTMKVNELKELAKEAKIKGWWEMKKAELIAELEALENESEAVQNEFEEVVTDNTDEEPKADTTENETSETDVEPKAKHRGNVIEFNGKSQNLEAWAKELGFRPQTLYGRLYVSGWTIEKAFTTPSKRSKKE